MEKSLVLPVPKRPNEHCPRKRVILITIFDSIGLINHEFLPNWQTVDSDFYIQVIRRFREKLRKKRPEMWKIGDWILQHDGASSLTSAQTRSYMENMEKYKFEILLYPAYSPELAPCNFFLFPTIKKSLSGVKFETDDEIQDASSAALYQLPDTSFQMSFQHLQHRWIKAINSEGAYFEGDRVSYWYLKK